MYRDLNSNPEYSLIFRDCDIFKQKFYVFNVVDADQGVLFKYDSVGRCIFGILRYLGRIKEERQGGNIVYKVI